MGDVVEFPNRALDGFDDLKAAISDELRGAGCGTVLINWILSEWDRRLLGWFPANWEGRFDPPGAIKVEEADIVRAAIKSREQIILSLSVQILLDLMELSALRFNVPSAQVTPTKARVFELISGRKSDGVSSTYQAAEDQEHISPPFPDRQPIEGRSLETSPVERSRTLFRLDPTSVETQFLPPRQYSLPVQRESS